MSLPDIVTEEEAIARLNIGKKITIRYSEFDSKKDISLNGVYEGPASQNGGVAGREEESYHRFIHRLVLGEPKIISVALPTWDISLDLISNIIDTDPHQREFNENKIIYTPKIQGWEKRNKMLEEAKL